MQNLSDMIREVRNHGLRVAWASVAHMLRTQWVEAKYADPEHPLRGLPLVAAFLRSFFKSKATLVFLGPDIAAPGSLVSYMRRGQELIAEFENATLNVVVLAPDLMRIQIQPLGVAGRSALYPSQYTFERPDQDWPPCTFEVVEGRQALEVRTSRLTCAISREDGRLAFYDSEGAQILEEVQPTAWTAKGVTTRFHLPVDSHLYGLGQRTVGLDRRGGSYVNWNTDPHMYELEQDPVDLCIPIMLGLHSGGQQGYGLSLANTVRSRFDLGHTDPDTISFEVEDQVLGYDFFYGPQLTTVLERYTERTGRTSLYPLWVLGYHQCRWSYFPEERIRRLADDFLKHDVPCDGLHLDIHYMDGYRCFTWDAERFPDPEGMIDDLHAQGFKVVTIIDPGIKVDSNYWVFREGLEQNMFCSYPDGRPFFGPVWPGDCGFPDFTSARVREWWGGLYSELVKAGVDGFWNDMNEPAVFGDVGTTIPDPIRHDLDGREGDHRTAHNIYGLLMARATAEGVDRLMGERRSFVFSRSGWSGLQRYAANWTGDNESSWESLRLTIPMVLGLGLSGIPFTGPDIGGFLGFATGEMFTRWLQLAVFLPFVRSHTHWDSPDQEPWSWGEPFLSINREFIRLRYRFLPYIYTALWQSSQTGIPMARPLFLHFQDDPDTFTADDQFMCGDSLLIAPVMEKGATSRSVYLPAGPWYDYWTGVRHVGPLSLDVEAPLDHLPIYVKAGAVVTTGPQVANTSQIESQPPMFHVFPGHGDSWLYEDDGVSKAYLRGEHQVTHFTVSGSEDHLVVTRHTDGPFDPGYDRCQVEIHGVDGTPKAIEGLSGVESSFAPEQRAVVLQGGLFNRLELRW
jgi:alpha-glucosidase